MGIEAHVANIIVREHAWKPITGDILLLGRQTMFFPPSRAIDMLRASGLLVPLIEFAPEAETRQAHDYYISDRDFFRLLEIDKIKALDVSDYEGADIVHDLTVPLPPHLEGIADFILDGSTLDNVFDPSTVLRNMARLLKPHGRFVSVNVGSNTHGPYLIPTAHWLLDYFVANGFADCKVYVLVYGGPQGQVNVFTPDLSLMRQGIPQTENFTAPYTFALCVVGEKAPTSTWDVSPVQHQYRSDWKSFVRNLAVIEGSKRPEMAWSTGSCFVTAPQFRFVDHTGRKVSAVEQPPEPTPAAPPNSLISGRQALRVLRERLMDRVLPARG